MKNINSITKNGVIVVGLNKDKLFSVLKEIDKENIHIINMRYHQSIYDYSFYSKSNIVFENMSDLFNRHPICDCKEQVRILDLVSKLILNRNLDKKVFIMFDKENHQQYLYETIINMCETLIFD